MLIKVFFRLNGYLSGIYDNVNNCLFIYLFFCIKCNKNLRNLMGPIDSANIGIHNNMHTPIIET